MHELTLAPPLLRYDTASYTCEAVLSFVQNFTETSNNIAVFILGESLSCKEWWSFWLNSLWCILTNITISPSMCSCCFFPSCSWLASSSHLSPSNQSLLCVPASAVHVPAHVITISSVNNLPHISVFLYLIMIFHIHCKSHSQSAFCFGEGPKWQAGYLRLLYSLATGAPSLCLYIR